MAVATIEAAPAIDLGPPCPHCKDAWVWIAMYREGDMLTECPGGAPTRRHSVFADIDLERVVSMALIPQRLGLPQIVVQMTEPTMRPVFFRRRYVELNVGSEQTVGNQTIHCLGWRKESPSGETIWSFTFAFEDASILITSDRNAV